MLASEAGVYGGASANTSKLYSLSSTTSGDYVLRDNSGSANTWHSMTPYKGSIATFTVKHDRDGNATIYGGVVGYLHSNATGDVSKYLYSTAHISGCQATINEVAPYSIVYNANGGNGAPPSQAVYATYDYNLSTTIPTKVGYTFLGWSTESTATTATYQPNDSVTINGNLVLYAVWQKNTYILSITKSKGATVSVLRNGSSLVDGDTINYGDVLSISISANTGYNINVHTVNGTNWTSGNFTVTQAVSIIATATLISYSLSIATSSSGVTTQINRVSSPIGEGTIGQITNGATLYYNDVLSINYTIGGAYQLISATVNNIDISDNVPYSLTVNSNVVVNILVKLGAIDYIGNEAYQAFIGTLVNGNVIWQQYQAFIGNGSTYDQY